MGRGRRACIALGLILGLAASAAAVPSGPMKGRLTRSQVRRMAAPLRSFFSTNCPELHAISHVLGTLRGVDRSDPTALEPLAYVARTAVRDLRERGTDGEAAGVQLQVLEAELGIFLEQDEVHFVAKEAARARSLSAAAARAAEALAAEIDVGRLGFGTPPEASMPVDEGGRMRVAALPEGWRLRRPLSPERRAALDRLPDETKAGLPRDDSAGYEDYVVKPDDVRLWAKRYEEATGTRPAYADDLIRFLRDQGDALLALYERPARIGVISFSGKKSDELAMKTMMTAMLWQLHKEGVPLADVSIIGGLTDMTGIKASYQAADLFETVEKQGISGGKAIVYPVASVDKAAVVGTSFGPESRLFLETANYIIGMGGGAQGERELRWFIQRRSDRAFLAEGFLEIKPDGKLVPGAVEKIEPGLGGRRVVKAAENPLEAGASIGREIATLYKAEKAESHDSILQQLAVTKAPGGTLVESERVAESNVRRARLLSLMNQVRKRLMAAGIAAALLSNPLADAAALLAEAVRGVDNYTENATWQRKALEAFAAGPEPIARIAGQLAQDVMFASWYGMGSYEAAASEFARAAPVPEEMLIPLPNESEHTFDLRDYTELRLEIMMSGILTASDARIEMFLGTGDELRGHYAEYEFRRLADSNGTIYYLLRRGDERLVAIHGVDSPSRMLHVSTLLRLSGVDMSRVRVRGDMGSLRRKNRVALQTRLSSKDFDHPIAAIVVGDRANVFAELARRAGVGPAELTREPLDVGPFRGERVLVKAAGTDEPHYLLAFSPAYGELTYDLVRAAYAADVTAVMASGAGGTTRKGDSVGAMHELAATEFRGERLELGAIPGLRIARVPGATSARNVTSPTPLEQSRDWVERVVASGADDVDQESFHLVAALRDALAEDRAKGLEASVLLQPGLYQSDVVGSGGLGVGTVDVNYGPTIMRNAGAFLDELGVSAVATRQGERPLPGAQPGELARAAANSASRRAAAAIEAEDLSSVYSTQGWGHFIKQFKGQKRVLQIATVPFVSDERGYLRQLLSRLKAKRFWIAVRQSDPNAIELLALAREKGFETLLIRDVPDEPVHGTPTFVLVPKDGAEADAWADELVRPADQDPYEPNAGRHRRLMLSGAHPAPEEHPELVYRGEFDLAEAARLAAEMNREAGASNERVKAEVERRFEKAGLVSPDFPELDEVDRFIDGRVPVLISGASKKAWPNVTPQNQALVRETLERLLATLDPRRHVVVTGGTEFGVEQIAHEIAARRGFDILSTITENTNPAEVTLHATALVPTSINWYGKSRMVLENDRRRGGVVLFQGGGAILADEIELARRMGVTRFLQRGPEGAAAEAAKTNPNESFDAFDEMLPRLARVLGPR